jgi:hypothetical protein
VSPDSGVAGVTGLIAELAASPDRLAEAREHTAAVARRYAPGAACARIARQIECVASSASS